MGEYQPPPVEKVQAILDRLESILLQIRSAAPRPTGDSGALRPQPGG
jgi:hypothetical protein